MTDVKSTLVSLAQEFPEELVAEQLADVPRVAFQIGLVLSEKGQARNCDLGSGIGLFTVGCAALGIKSILVDDFADAVNLKWGDSVLDLHRSHGVEVISRNVVDEGLDLEPATLDSVTCFDSMEHWHRSPKRLFHSMLEALVPGGLFVLGVPNCVNLRKRLTVPFGRGKWSSMEMWYEAETFRGHVREPDIDDLLYIARDLGLQNVRVHGRNWMGLISPDPRLRLLTRLLDRPLRLRPTLCSDIYLVASKPAS